MDTIGTTFTGGINADYHPKFLQQGQYKYALNAVAESTGEDMGGLSTESGNQFSASIKSGYTVIGSIPTNDNKFILFSCDDTTSDIGEYNPAANTYTSLINTTCLNFSTDSPIHGVFRIRNGCERIIYFTDRKNQLRVINLDELATYKTSTGDWDCSRFSLSRDIIYPAINYSIKDVGGSLEAGSYQFTIRLLDVDGNSSNWSLLTAPIPISLGNQLGTWTGIKGAYEDTYSTVEKGSVPNTNKSIQLTISGLDSSYQYYQLAVIKNLEGLGIATETVLLPRTSFSNSSIVYNYTGSKAIEEKASVEEITIDKVPIDIVNTLASVNNSLWLGGVSTKSYDWAKFQRKASLITARPKVTAIPAYKLVEGNPKSYNYFGYTPDEIESFDIVYVSKDGTYSPAFHIPGRRINDPVETSLLNTWVPDMEPWVSEEDFNANYAKIEADTDTKPFLRHYQVFNTGDATTFAYYQSSQVYPDIRDCTGASVWGVDSEGGTLANTPIRYHRFPELNNYSMFVKGPDGTIYYNKLDVEFDNIEYPDEDIVSHFFVQAKKTDQDKVVKDQGIITPTLLNPSKAAYYYDPTNIKGRAWSSTPRVLWNVFTYFSAKSLYEAGAPNGSYLKLNGVFSAPYQESKKYEVDPTEGRKIDVWMNIDDRTEAILHPFTAESKYNYIIHGRSFVDPGAYQQSPLNPNYGYLNTSLSQGLTFLELFKTNTGNDKITINTPITPDPFKLSIPRILVTVKDIVEPFQDLFSQEYIPLQGNWILSPLEVMSVLDEDLDFKPTKPILSFSNRSLAEAQYVNGLWAGSEYNFSLRTYPNVGCNTHFLDPGRTGVRLDQMFSYVMGKIAERQESGKYKFLNLEEICKEVYNLNKDYSKVSEERIFYPLPVQYDYCTSCNNTHPNRIFKSKNDNLESYVDNFRVFLANEYSNLDGSGDAITQFFVDKDELYALTNNYIYAINTRPQELKTDVFNAYIGSASTFVIPPKRLASPSHSYGGTTQPLSVVSTEFGTIWTDATTGRIFHLGQGLDEISMAMMSSFFETEAKLVLAQEFTRQTSLEYPYTWQVTDSMGIGITAGYDPRLKRLLITKRDYRPKYPISLETNTIKSDSIIYFDTNSSSFYVYGSNVRTPITLQDTAYFTDISWTASYSFKNKVWTSFHSYTPNLYLNNSSNYFTPYGDKLYSFNASTYRTYYGTVFPFQVEATLNSSPSTDKTFEAWTVGSSAYKNSDAVDKMFNSVWAYNNNVSTGKVNLAAHTPWSNSNTDTAYWRKIKSKYNFSMLRDKTPTGNFYTVGAHKLDKTPVQANISPFNQGRLAGDYINLRMSLTDSDNTTKFILETVESAITKSSR